MFVVFGFVAWVVLGGGNFLYQHCTNRDWQKALDSSFLHGIYVYAAFIYWFSLQGN
jgi:hypothetical protein